MRWFALERITESNPVSYRGSSEIWDAVRLQENNNFILSLSKP